MPKIKEGKFKRISQTKGFLVFMGIVLCFFLFSAGRELWRRAELEIEIADLQEEIVALEEKNTELNNLIEYFNSSNWQEMKLRQRLGLQKEGETMVIIPEGQQVQPEKVVLATEEKLPGPQKWWNYFFKQQ